MDNKQRCTLGTMHHSDKMCLDKMQQTHGSFTTAGSTAYSIIRKIESLFASFKIWFTGLMNTITEEEVHQMWEEENNN